MFKKDASEEPMSAQPHLDQPVSAGKAARAASKRSGEPATIGPSITIKGDVTGDEDLVIQGKIEGKVDLAQHNVTIGPEGRVKADVFGQRPGEYHSPPGRPRRRRQLPWRHRDGGFSKTRRISY
jgi:hypothetical protein